MSDSHRAEVQNAKTTSEGGSANSSLTYDNVMQNQYSTVRRVHIFACAILGLDDSDHEDDDEAKPLEDAIMALLDAERERWIGEVLTDILRYKKKDGTGWVIDAHIVADRLSKVLEGLQ